MESKFIFDEQFNLLMFSYVIYMKKNLSHFMIFENLKRKNTYLNSYE